MPGYLKKAATLSFPAGQERAIVLFLDTHGAVKGSQAVAVGGRGMVDVQIDAMLATVKLNQASSFVLIHNHPSGALTASKADVAATFAITEAAQRAGLPLRDHLVYAHGRVKSIRTAKRGLDCPDCAFVLRDFPGDAGRATLKAAHALARENRRPGEKYPDALKRAWEELRGQGKAEFPGPHGGAHQQDAHALAKNIRQPGEPYSQALKRAWAQLRKQTTDSQKGSQKKTTVKSRPAARPAAISRQKSPRGITNTGESTSTGIIPDAGDNPKAAPAGRPQTVATGPDPTKKFSLYIDVVDLDQLIPSHTDAIGSNPDYPAELQPRIRDRAASRQQIEQIAANLEAGPLVMDTGTLDRGMPIVGHDNVVLSGNGRILAIRRARANHHGNFENYQKAVRAEVKAKYPDLDAAGLGSPALVRVQSPDLQQVDRVAFAAASNEATTLTMSPLEQALQDAGRITDGALAELTIGDSQSVDQALVSPSNRGLVSQFIAGLAENERAGLVGSGGELNLVGLQRLKAAIFAKVYPGDAGQRLTKAFVESLDPILKNMESAMFESLPAMARAEGLIASGARTADLTLADDMAKSVDMLARLKSTNQTAEDFVRQSSAFGRELNIEQERLLIFLEAQGRSRKVVKEFLQGYAENVVAAPHPDQGAMFADTQETKGELLARLIDSHTKKASTGALFELVDARQKAGLLADPLKPGGRHWGELEGTAGLSDSDVLFAVRSKRPFLLAGALTVAGHRAEIGETAGVVVTSAGKKAIQAAAKSIKTDIEIEEPTGADQAAAGFQAELVPGMFQRSTEADAPPEPEQARMLDSKGPARFFEAMRKAGSSASDKLLAAQVTAMNVAHSKNIDDSNSDRILNALEMAQQAMMSVPLRDPGAGGPPGVSLEDIPYEAGVRAHNGTSWVPEKRAEQEQFAWVQWMGRVWAEMNKRATTDGERGRVPTVFEEFRAWALPAQLSLLGRRAGLVSSMIAGPSKFNFRQAGKRGDAYHNALGEHIKQEERRLKRALETIRPRTNGPISSGDPEAVQKLQAKIDKAKAFQDTMKEANRIIRQKGVADLDKQRALERLEGISAKVASNLVAGDFMQRKGFPAYETSGNLANIKRMEGRIVSIERERAIPEMDVTFDGGTIVEDKAANRLRIFFDSKPEPEIRTKLKRAGFRWSPSAGAWQRQLNENARLAAHQVIVDRRIGGEGERAPAAETPAEAREPEIPAHPDPVGTDEATEAEKPTAGPITGQPSQLQLLDPEKRRRGAKTQKKDSGEGGAFRHLITV